MTAVGVAREIIRAGQIETRVCKALGANLVYFFALRPAYKLRDADQKNDILDYFPFVFLVSADNLGAPYHVYARHVPLGDVRFAILPYQFLEDPHGPNTDMIDRLNAAGVAWETYQWRPNRAPADFHSEINRLVRDHLATSRQL
ncbi:hypothetical protein [Sphingobium sp. TomTYG45]